MIIPTETNSAATAMVAVFVMLLVPALFYLLRKLQKGSRETGIDPDRDEDDRITAWAIAARGPETMIEELVAARGVIRVLRQKVALLEVELENGDVKARRRELLELEIQKLEAFLQKETEGLQKLLKELRSLADSFNIELEAGEEALSEEDAP